MRVLSFMQFMPMCVSWDFWPVLLDTASKKAVLIILEKFHDVKRKNKKTERSHEASLHFSKCRPNLLFYTCNAMQKKKKRQKSTEHLQLVNYILCKLINSALKIILSSELHTLKMLLYYSLLLHLLLGTLQVLLFNS